jgi:dTDP-4-dehydrorhamnose reductase
MKTIVFGSAGQLGRDLVPMIPGEVISLTRADADLTKSESITDVIRRHSPNVIVNCAAYNLVDKAESEPEAAFAVNAWAPRAMAGAAKEVGAKLVHVSTDYVYGLDSDRTKPFSEDDAPGPISVYGLSKLNGEYLVRSTLPNHLVIRTCGLYGVWGSGGKGGNFVETMLRVAGQGKPLKVVNDQHCTPSYTKDVAQTITHLIAKNAQGLFQVVNTGGTNWHDFAAEIFRLSKLNVELSPIRTSERNDPARRPPYSVLDTAKLRSVGVAPPRAWQEALAAYLRERQDRARSA